MNDAVWWHRCLLGVLIAPFHNVFNSLYTLIAVTNCWVVNVVDRFVVLPLPSGAGVLSIENVQSSDAGIYGCRALNMARERHSNNATLEVVAAGSLLRYIYVDI